MRKFLGTLVIIFFVLIMGAVLFSVIGVVSLIAPVDQKPKSEAILALDLEGVILDGKELLENLDKYAKDDLIKGVLIRVNSPGGLVGPSQEIYAELKRVRDELKKPVVISVSSLAASGALYAAMGASKVVTNPGSIMGSIGVIMEFANLEGLYNWAKINRYAIKTGTFKDSGADYREMTPEERELFQAMIDEVLGQFKTAIAESRKIERDVLDKNADGRVFSGETAVKLGFADQLGTYQDAKKLIGQMTGLGDDPELLEPRPPHDDWMSILEDLSSESRLHSTLEKVMSLKLETKPLLLMPGTWGVGR